MDEQEVLMNIAIDARKRQSEVTTLRRGKGRHQHYAMLRQAPPEVRGEALQLIRTALQNAGFESLAELEESLTSEIAVPGKVEEEAAQAEGATEGGTPKTKKK